MGTDEITTRLKRVEGQVRGLQRMVEEQRDCESILTQLMAARAALDRVGLLVADSYVQECLTSLEGPAVQAQLGRVLEMIFSRFSVPSGEEAALVAADDVSPNDTMELIKED